MGGFTTHPRAHRRDQNLGGGEERQVSVQLALDHGGVGTEFVEHGQHGLDLPVDGEEAVRQRNSAYYRAENVAFVPLRAGQFGGHRSVAAQQHL